MPVKRRKKEALPPYLRNMVYSFLEFREKFRMTYLCKKEYKFLAEWKLYDKESGSLNNSIPANMSQASPSTGLDASSQIIATNGSSLYS